MEKNIHNDHLDDYVRKSFEDYEENPASDMWGRIEEELPPVVPEPVVRPGIGSIRRYFWQMSAAAAILLLISSLVCGRLYYENKIREISAVQQNTQGTAPQKPVPPPYPAVPVAPHTASETQNPKPQSLNPVSQTVVPQSGPGNTSNRNIADKVENHVSFPPMFSPFRVFPPTPKGKNISNKESIADKVENIFSSPPMFSPLGVGGKDQRGTEILNLMATPPFPPTSENPAIQAPPSENSAVFSPAINPAISVDSILQLPDFQLLKNIKTPFVSYTLSGFQPPILPIKPLRMPSGWYLGVQMTPVLLVEKTKSAHTGMMRPRVISTQEKSSYTADYWLKAGKQLQGRWGFETGIGYRAMERNATHMPRFRFINGRPGGTGGSQMRSYDFDYDLDTYGGSSEVTLRMDQVDPNASVPEDEPLQIQVKTSERVQLLRIPALLTARLGQGRITGVIKAGLIGNMVLRNEVDIVTRVSENTRFRPGEGNTAYTLRPDKNKKFFLGYQVSAGLEYHPTKHFSWVLEPSVARDFARKNSAGKQLPSIVTMGLNVGMNYYF